MEKRRGPTLHNEAIQPIELDSLDEVAGYCGYTAEQITQTVDENEAVEHHVRWAEYMELEGEDKNNVNIDVILPNGSVYHCHALLSWSIFGLKENILRYMKRMEFVPESTQPWSYVLHTVGDDGEEMMLYDEVRPLNAINMFLPIIEMAQPEDAELEFRLNKQISTIVGLDLKSIETRMFDEGQLCRLELYNSALQADALRGISGTKHYAFPEETILPNIADRVISPNLHLEVHEEDVEFEWYPSISSDDERKSKQDIKKKVERSQNGIEVWFRPNENTSLARNVGIRDIFDKIPDDIIKMALDEMDKDADPDDYILQVIGRRSFITLPKPILKFEYVRSCFENYRDPKLLLRPKNIVFKQYPYPIPIFEPYFVRSVNFNKVYPYLKEVPATNFWDLDEPFKINIRGLTNAATMESITIFLTVGRHVLDKKTFATNQLFRNLIIDFDLYLKNLPEPAQISIIIEAAPKKEKKKKSEKREIIAYGNFRLFDWRHFFMQGRHTLTLWPVVKPMTLEDMLSDNNGSNPDGTAVRVDVEIFKLSTKELEFPNKKKIEKFADFVALRHHEPKIPFMEIESILPGSQILARVLRLKAALDGSRLPEEDQIFLWNARFKLRELFPQLVIVLADCSIIYKTRETLCEFYMLLKNWPQINVDTAVEMLDTRFRDCYVREFAVRRLDQGTDNDQIRLYLLPLVQCLRYEPYFTSPLADLLVRRALMDFKVGHTFFWLIRSELSSFTDAKQCTVYYLRLALMCEAYCRGNAIHLPSMLKQVEMVNKLTELSDIVKPCPKADATKKLKSELLSYVDAIQNLQSPLNQCEILGELDVDQCRVLGSAKMPLKLRWHNPEPLSHLTNPVHEIIFKNGDDLRQDMLTLQLMRLMDAKWKNYNLDYCLTLYEVLPMGANIGMIHVVQHSRTLFQIQCASKTMTSSIAMETDVLSKHFYNMCVNEKKESKKYMDCVDRFTSSLSGYCIATYILGIKDRHHDNLMIADDGRLLHIDFGHILGHVKKKLGINRERTDFIVTDHFLCFVSHGQKDYKSSYMFEGFRDSCAQGYLVLHYHRRFFVALINMMKCMELPELQSESDIAYLFKSLQYNNFDRSAVHKKYIHVFDKCVSDWTTSVNWFFHSVKHRK